MSMQNDNNEFDIEYIEYDIADKEEKAEEKLPFEISGLESEKTVEEPVVKESKEEKVEEKKEKKKTDKQVSLFSF